MATIAVVHHPEDVTRAAWRQGSPVPAELTRAAAALGRQFPGLPAEAVLEVLSHSHSVVMEALGAPDFERAEQLARLRLETRAGRPAGQA